MWSRSLSRAKLGGVALLPSAGDAGLHLPHAPVFGARGGRSGFRRTFFPGATDQPARLPSAGAGLALPRSGAVVNRNRTHQNFLYEVLTSSVGLSPLIVVNKAVHC